MSETKNNPLAVYCSYCGAPAEYDIVHQEYHCGYCGGTTDIHEPVQRLGEWRDARKKEVLKDKSVAEEKCVCQNCGAEVVIPEGEAMGNCEFCGGKFARRAFAASTTARTRSSEPMFPGLILTLSAPASIEPTASL